MKSHLFKKALVLLLFISPLYIIAQTDPLPSWKEGELKTKIIQFVKDASTEGSGKFVPADDRIATFDNDGTLWAEKPLIQGLFAFYRAKKMVEKNPALKTKQPYKAIAENDLAYLKSLPEKELIKLVVATHSNVSESEFEQDAVDFFATAKAPSGKPIAELVYQPQIELLKYLRENGFKTFICTGGDIEFVRAISEKYYGIPAEQVIGSSFKYTYRDSAGVNDVIRLPQLNSLNDKKEKPVNIQYHIGKRPILACGNEGGAGDVYMLRFSQGQTTYPSMQLIVNHDDKDREFYYQEKDNLSLNWAKKYGWQVISMKNDWNTVFVTGQ